MQSTPYKKTKDPKDRILTIPNVLSTIRIILVPILVWLYYVKQDNMQTAIVLLLSGATDIADGFIARRFNMSSNLGKIIDPIADKLTQAALLLCLIFEFPLMLAPLVLLVGKEIIMGYTGVMVIKKTGKVHGAKWHGKAATVLLYSMMFMHIVWADIPKKVSDASIVICIIMMVISLVLYILRNMREIKEGRKEEKGRM